MRLNGLLAVVVFGCGVLVAAEPVLFDLDGREAVVRKYMTKMDYNAGVYGTVTVKIDGRYIEAHVEDANDSTILKLVGEDQKDEVVKQYLGSRGRSWRWNRGPRFYLPMMEAELDGREAVARIYKNGERDVSVYDRLSAVISKRKIKLDVEDTEEELVVAIFGADQRDPVVREALGTTVQGWNYVKGFELRMPSEEQASKSKYCWVFCDALGDAIGGVTVEWYLKNREGQGILLGRYVADDGGKVCLPFSLGRMRSRTGGRICRFQAIVRSVAYGATLVEISLGEQEGDLFIPRVPVGSEADERSAWGRVVNSNGNSVVGTVVWGSGVIPSGAKWGGDVEGQRFGVLTDGEGRFRMYVPIRGDAEQIGALIPPKSKYYIRILPSKGSGLLEYRGRILNGQDNKIVLERGYFRRFAFEGENGEINDSRILRDIDVRIHRPGQNNDVYIGSYSKWKDGGGVRSG